MERSIGPPDLPPGNLRSLMVELHVLYARAGRPGLRQLAKPGTISHTTVGVLLRSTTVPKLPRLLHVVDQLASMVRGVNPVYVLDRFDALWTAAEEHPYDDPPPPDIQAEGRPAARVEVDATTDPTVLDHDSSRWDHQPGHNPVITTEPAPAARTLLPEEKPTKQIAGPTEPTESLTSAAVEPEREPVAEVDPGRQRTVAELLEQYSQQYSDKLGFRRSAPATLKPRPQSDPESPRRNQACSCGSGRKYKHCHGVPRWASP